MHEDYIDLGHTKFIIRKDGIIESICSDDFTYEKQHIQENLMFIKSQMKDKKLLVLNCVGQFTSISSEARAYVASGPHVDFIQAEAFLIQSLAQKIIARFFIKIDKPKVKANFFTKKEEAIEWLKKQR